MTSETIWHITPTGKPAGVGPEGFIHASFTSQLAGTLALHFPDTASVHLLRLDPERLGARLVIEPSREDALFPHIYGVIEPGDILGHELVERGPNGHFDLTALRA